MERQLAGIIADHLRVTTGRSPSESERKSWRRSLPVLVQDLIDLYSVYGFHPAAGSTQNNSASNSGYRQVFVRDTCLGVSPCTPKTTRISLQPGDGTEGAPATATPAGPALSGDAKKIALSGGGSAVLFMQSVAVDDRLFVAVLGQSK